MCEACENDAMEWHNVIPGFTLKVHPVPDENGATHNYLV